MAAQALAANGAKVYIAGRRLEALQTAAEAHGKGDKVEGELIPLQMDETDIESVKKAFEEISKKEDKLNLLVNNAGLAGPRADVSAAEKGPEAFKEAMLKLPKSAWDDVVSPWLFCSRRPPYCEQPERSSRETQINIERHFTNRFKSSRQYIQYNTNVYGYYYTSATFLPLLVKANKEDSKHKISKDYSANIINICSISGITKMTQNGQFIYNSSKAATIQLTKLLATEFSKPNLAVRVK